LRLSGRGDLVPRELVSERIHATERRRLQRQRYVSGIHHHRVLSLRLLGIM
jgi:hypothetical protein